MRERKKRGKVSRKDLQNQQALSAVETDLPEPTVSLVLDHQSRVQSPEEISYESGFAVNGVTVGHLPTSADKYRTTSNGSSLSGKSELLSSGDAFFGIDNFAGGIHHPRSSSGHHLDLGSVSNTVGSTRPGSLSCSAELGVGDSGTSPAQHPSSLTIDTCRDVTKDGARLLDSSHHYNTHPLVSPTGSFQLYSPHRQESFGIAMSQSEGRTPTLSLHESSLGPWSPACFSLPSPAPSSSQRMYPEDSTQPLQYPVLQPLLPLIRTIIPVSLACELLEKYFEEATEANLHPLSPYILSYVYRKNSFFHPTHPRRCSPALLASILWVAARSPGKPGQIWLGEDRERICQRLLELTLRLLRPRIRDPLNGGIGYKLAQSIDATIKGGNIWQEFGAVGVTQGLHTQGYEQMLTSTSLTDDVATLMNLAVLSAIDCPSKGLQWWKAAWALAKRGRFNQELPYGAMISQSSGNMADSRDGSADSEPEIGGHLQLPHGGHLPTTGDKASSHPMMQQTENSLHNTLRAVRNEDREERRRIWWLLYILDRHLSLCCDRPLRISDRECDGLLEPMDETRWQMGDFGTGDSHSEISESMLPHRRWTGCDAQRTHHTIFAYFLPLTGIIGETLQLKTQRESSKIC